MTTSPAIALEGVGKRFWAGWRGRWVLEKVDFEVAPGEVLGLIGANGAGKTTLFKLLAGFTRPSRGRVRVLGRDPRRPEARKRLAYLPENPRFPEHLSGREVLMYLAAVEGLPRRSAEGRVARLLDQVALSRLADAAVRHYSKGMVQRLAMAQCFLGEPELALLDEPMSGLDPAGRQLMAGLIGELRASGATVLFSTHVPADLERCATGLVVLKEGRVTKLPLADLNDAAGLLEEFYGACRAG